MTVPILDPRLSEVAGQLEDIRWAAAICDPEWSLLWVSSELQALIGERDPVKLGIGRHMLECLFNPTWASRITEDSRRRALARDVPLMVGGTPGGKGRLIQILGERFEDIVEGIEPTEPPPLCTSRLDFIQGDLPPVAVHSIAVRLSDSDGKLLGHVLVYGSGLPAGILALVARGDPGMLERMTRLHRPGKRRAALLFADLQSSGILARRLSSAAYFRFAQSLTTAMDEVVVRRNGIIGKHAGDGLTAFFLAEHLGSASAAARAAIESARAIRHAAAAVAGELGDAGLIQPRDCLVNVGIHWGATLYMGQLVTGGRLEITALGDEVNQCARIQQSARGGEALASKALLEHLCEADASALGLDPEAIMYRMVAELPEADAKALRDAGGLPVASV